MLLWFATGKDLTIRLNPHGNEFVLRSRRLFIPLNFADLSGIICTDDHSSYNIGGLGRRWFREETECIRVNCNLLRVDHKFGISNTNRKKIGVQHLFVSRSLVSCDANTSLGRSCNSGLEQFKDGS